MMATFMKKQIIEKAFERLQAVFKLPLVLKDAREGKYHDGTMTVEYSYHFKDGRVWDYSRGFGSYWFDKEEWDKTEKSYRGGLNPDVEKLVPSSINVNEQTMAVLRIAARLYIETKHLRDADNIK